MNNYKMIEKNLWKASFPLISGVLTSLIYEEISPPSYVLDIHGEQYIFTSTETKFWGAVGFIIITFLLIWAVIVVVISLIAWLRKRFSYDKIRQVNPKDLIKTLDVAKDVVTELYPVFCNKDGNAPCTHLITLYNRDIARTILLLHGKFLPHNKRMRRNVEQYFRNPDHSSVITVDRNISGYEFESIIAILSKMVETVEIKGYGDKLLKKDCSEMKKSLDELEKLSEKIKIRRRNEIF